MTPEIVNGLFGLGGALIGVVGTWWITRTNKESTKVTIFSAPSARLLAIDDLAKSDVEILYKSNRIEELFQGEIAIQNTGTSPLESIRVNLTPDEEAPLFDVDVSSANFQIEEGFVAIEETDGVAVISIKYLNPNDKLVVGYRSSGSKEPTVNCRKLGLDVELKEEAISWIPDIYITIIFKLFDQTPPPIRWYLKHSLKEYRLYLEAEKSDAA